MDKIIKEKLSKIMKDYMVEYYKSEIAYVKQITGLLDSVNNKDNLLTLKKLIENKIK